MVIVDTGIVDTGAARTVGTKGIALGTQKSSQFRDASVWPKFLGSIWGLLVKQHILW